MNNVIDSEDDDTSGRAKGGKARAAKMTPEERRASSLKAVEAKKTLAALPKVSHKGELVIGEMSLACCVLKDGRRIISENAINSNLGSSGGKTYKLRDATSSVDAVGPLPLFLASKALQPFIPAVLASEDLLPIEYFDGNKVARGFEASILPKVCEIWLRAADKKVLQPSQYSRAKKAETLVRGLAQVGIVALVDEATGYQKDRERDALAKYLEEFIAKEMRPWVKTYPAEFFEELCRLRGIPFKANMRHPQYFGHLINNITYDRMVPSLREALQVEKKKANKTGIKMHQFLSDDSGAGLLHKRLVSVVDFMKASDSYDDFIKLLDRVYPVVEVQDFAAKPES
ncbi:P63C domain [Serratia quinivorans]|uniref:P63C domain-containing protein n=1 Tax=Serratia quinivorans TaxID=137545 RepID=UPI00217AF010|nr:P63C domain-containing protein [Serratia quinivorans]CAI0844643.1 P63C domain [Serratia quinivorans]CAI0892486.1 P63C domain [Serratia quinivorans]CAI1682877.1 P63C domain [Serratia quinivorans]CAI2081036.1 P63C domain [Serratia quinivorans]CAI2438139.1 P63C domain [Serratia quinivorans]